MKDITERLLLGEQPRKSMDELIFERNNDPNTKLVCHKSDGIDDWYVLEVDLNGAAEESWMEPMEYGASFCTNTRISDADVEGTMAEMQAIANAILTSRSEVFHRCAVIPSGERGFYFYSPRNSSQENWGLVSKAAAIELANQIKALA